MLRPRSAFVVLVYLELLTGLVSAMRYELLESRAAQTNAVCLSDFSWANNAELKSPCQVAAEVLAVCNGGNWVVPAINSTVAYTNPDATTANPCTCSWAAYNLLSACAECQGIPQAVQNWPVYKLDCGSFASNDTYYPAGFLTQDTTIPFWATTNPSTWLSQHFSVADAKAISQQGHPDVGAPPPPITKRKTPIGAIVGGVVGGIVAIAIAVGIAFFIILERGKKPPPPTSGEMAERPGHERSASDLTTKSGGVGYTTLSSSPGFPTHVAPTIRTHNTSVHSLSFFGSANGSMAIPNSPSPPPGRQMSPPINPQDLIIPFTTLQPISKESDRKVAAGGFPVYDPPNAPPIMSVIRNEDAIMDTPSKRQRVNPPAYSAQDTSGSPSPPPLSQRPPHNKQGSADTSYSFDSSGGGMTPNISHAANNSVTAIAGVVNQMGIPAGAMHSRSNTFATSPTTPSRDVKRRPTDDSIEIA